MKKQHQEALKTLLISVLLLLFTTSAFSQVGINTTIPTETLHVNGNVRIDGDFKPGNVPGATDQLLISKGPGVPPAWGPGFLNTGQISNIGKFFSGTFDINSTYFLLSITDVNMRQSSTVTPTLVGPLPIGVNFGDFVITTEAATGVVKFHIANHTGFTFTNLQLSYVAFY